MALFKISKGNSSNLPKTYTEGYCYYCIDTGLFYIDHKNSSGDLIRSALNANDAKTLLGYDVETSFSGESTHIPTSAAIQAKLTEITTALNKKADTSVTDAQQTAINTIQSKLNGIEVGANNYTLPAATSTTLGGVKNDSSDNVTITNGVIVVDDNGHKHTTANITGLDTALANKYDSSAGATLESTVATMKNKLDGIDVNANKYSLPIATSTALGGIKSSSSISINSSTGVATVIDDSHNHVISNIDNLQSTLNTKVDNTTYQSTATDVTTLKTDVSDIKSSISNIEDELAEKLTAADVDSTLSASSANPVQNKAVQAAISKLETTTANNTSAANTAQNTANNSVNAISVSGTTLTYTKNDGSSDTQTLQDKNVYNAIVASGETVYVTGTTSSTASTGTQKFSTNLYFNNAGKLTSSQGFVGDLTGTASNATKATQDASGNVITTTYATKTENSTNLTTAKNYTDSAKTSVLASLTSHNTDSTAHESIRNSVSDLASSLNSLKSSVEYFLDADDEDFDQLTEIITYIESNRDILSSKVNVSDIIDNLTTAVTTKPLSANQGVAIKKLIDDLQTAINTANSNITNHKAFKTVGGITATSNADTLTLAGTAPITITTDSTNKKITIAANAASTSASGVVKLSDSTATTSSTVAATSTAVKSAYDTAIAAQNSLTTKTNISVLPNDAGEIKTKFRISNKGNTSGATWYYKICDLPTNNSGNYASAIVSGRIGGWTSDNMSSVSALIWNRETPGIALLDIAGNASAMSAIWGVTDLVLYTNGTSATAANTATLYAKCAGYYVFDLDLELFQSTASITYDGTYTTTTPSGTLAAQASTTTKRVEIVNGKLMVNGSTLSFTSHDHSVTYTPSGSVGNTSITPAGSISSTSVTPAGSVTSTFTGSAGSHTHTFTGSSATTAVPSGTTSVYSMTDVGSLPALSSAISNRCMTVTFSSGSLPTRSSVTLPSTSHTHTVTAAGTIKETSVTPVGTVASTFKGTAASHNHTFTGTAASHNHTFTGTAATVTSSEASN